jgi:predicted component of type VI protein secretion system
MARLLIKSNGFENRTLELRPGVNRIGRDAGCDFTISEDTVSSFHCEIEVTATGVTLRDNHSTNGTRLNGEPVQEAQLRAGQTLLLGYLELFVENTEFKIPAPVIPAPAPPAPVVEPAKTPAAPAVTEEKLASPLPAPLLAEVKLPAPTNGELKNPVPARHEIAAEASEKIQVRISPAAPPPVVSAAKAREPEKIEAKAPIAEKPAAQKPEPGHAVANGAVAQKAEVIPPAPSEPVPQKRVEPLPSGVTICPRHAQTLAIYTCAHCSEPLCSACVRRSREPNGRMIMLCESCLQKAAALRHIPAPIPPLPQKKSLFGFLRSDARPASTSASRREKASK